MRTVCLVLFAALGSGLRSHAALLTENAALRHQLAVLERQARGRPRLRPVDRLFLGVALSPVARLATGVDNARISHTRRPESQ